MIFKRIDKQTVNCIITPEDMKNHGLKIDDLFEKKEEAMEFLHMIINEARRRVNFKPAGAVTSMQMSVLPDRSISLIISEQSSEQFEMLMKKLKDKLGIEIPEEVRNELRGLEDDERIERLKDYAANIELQKTEQSERQTRIETDEPKTREFLYDLESFRDAVQCCLFIKEQTAEGAMLPDAELYQHGNGFYLLVRYEGAEGERFNKTALSLNEFGTMVTARTEVIAHIREVSPCVIRNNTVAILSEL